MSVEEEEEEEDDFDEIEISNIIYDTLNRFDRIAKNRPRY